MNLTADNYYSNAANYEYLSVSQYKEFAGTYGITGCEARAMASIRGEYEEEPSTAMMIGSYVDAFYEGKLDEFKVKNPEIFKKDGTLKAEFSKADHIIERTMRDDVFRSYMSGQKQVIMTGELFGAPWKVKIDSYHADVAIVDLKIMRSLKEEHNVFDLGPIEFIRYWGYDIQGAVYQEIVRQNTGKKLPFYIAGASKEKGTNIKLIHVADNYLAEALGKVEMDMPRILKVKSGEEEPCRCESCDYCYETEVLTGPISLADLTLPREDPYSGYRHH